MFFTWFKWSFYKWQVFELSLNNKSSVWTILINQTLSIWLWIQFRQRCSQIKDWRPNTFLNIFGLAWPWDPRDPGTYSRFFKVHSWLTYGWKSVWFWWYFHTFHENGDEVLITIKLQTPTKTILGAVLFMYLLTNTNIARI